MTIIGSNEWYAQKEVIVFDVETFINDVYNRFAGTPNEESREDLQQLFDKVLAMPRGGDASLYPNAHGPRPALLEVWHKAGDFWRANGFSKPARLLCDQHGIVINDENAQKIAAAKATINSTTDTTTTGAEETPQDANGITDHPASDMPVQVTETATATTAAPFSVCDGSAVAPQATTSDLASGSASDTADYDPGVIVPEATPSPTPRSRRTRRTRTTTTPQPSLFDDCEITESSEAPAETTADDEKVTDGNAFLNALKEIADNKTAREIAKGVGILAAVLIIYECGLIIPFALLGGLAGGFIK